MNLKVREVSSAMIALGYPTAREIAELLRWNDQRFAEIKAGQIRLILEKSGIPGLRSFDTGLHFARFRFYFCYPPPVRRQPALCSYPEGIQEAIQKTIQEAAQKGVLRARLGEFEVLKDHERPVWYVVRDNQILGISEKGEFRLPTVRRRSYEPQSPWGDGWSETAYLSFQLWGDSGQFLQVWVT